MQILVRWLQRFAMVVAAFGLAYLFVVMIQPYRFREVLAEKRGRVVDSKTGHGISDVAVIVNYQESSSSPAGHSIGCIHQKIVRTDAEGFYVVPGAANDIDVADDMLHRILPGFSTGFWASRQYYKEGYVREEAVEPYLAGVDQESGPRAYTMRERLQEKRGSAHVYSPIRLTKVDLSHDSPTVDAYVTYMGDLKIGAWCSPWMWPASEALNTLQAEIQASVRGLICRLPPRRVLSKSTSRSWFIDCPASAYFKNMRQILGEDLRVTTGDLCQSYSYEATDAECSEGGFKLKPLVVVTNLHDLAPRGPPRTEHVHGKAPCAADEDCKRLGVGYGSTGLHSIRGEPPRDAQ